MPRCVSQLRQNQPNPFNILFLFIMRYHDYVERSSWVLTQNPNIIVSAFSFIYHTTLYDDTVAHVALYLRQFDEKEFKFFWIGVGTERRTWKKTYCSRTYCDLHQGVSYWFVAMVISLCLLFVLHYLVEFPSVFVRRFITNIFQRKTSINNM